MKSKISKYLKYQVPLLILVFFILLAVASHINPYFGLDLVFTGWVQSFNNIKVLETMKIVSLVGNASSLPYFLASISLVLYLLKLKNEAIISLFAVSIALFSSSLLKIIIDRPRPVASLVDVYTTMNDKSFPSGHTMTYTVVFGFLIYLLAKKSKNKLVKYSLATLLIIPIVTIGFSRVYLGAHWMSDVLGGYLLGSFWLYFTILYYQSLQAVKS